MVHYARLIGNAYLFHIICESISERVLIRVIPLLLLELSKSHFLWIGVMTVVVVVVCVGGGGGEVHVQNVDVFYVLFFSHSLILQWEEGVRTYTPK